MLEPKYHSRYTQPPSIKKKKSMLKIKMKAGCQGKAIVNQNATNQIFSNLVNYYILIQKR